MSATTAQEILDRALSHLRAGQLAEAERLYQQVLASEPNHAAALHFLGIIASQTERNDLALDLLGRAIALVPAEPAFHCNLGVVFAARGEFESAVVAHERALALQPGYVVACYNLGSALENLGRRDEAVAAYQRTLALQPAHSAAQLNLANVFKDAGRLDEAIVAYRRVLAREPSNAAAWNNLGNALKDCGQIEEALDCCRRAVALKPDDAGPSNLVYSMLFDPRTDPRALVEEKARWHERHEFPLRREIAAPRNSGEPDRRLRIGYVSPDFRDHVVGRNMMPLFGARDRSHFEIHCYFDGAKADAFTQRFRALADCWRETCGMSDAALAERIRADQIDILVDLTQHMSGNRLLVFACRPAPVQVSFAGYPDSTGVAAIGHRISDHHLESNTGDTERVWLLDSFWCYDPCGTEAPVRAASAEAECAVTFGCLNHFGKVNERVLRLWACLLERVPDSQLLLLSPAGSHRGKVESFLASRGVEPDRVEFAAPRPRREYLELYQRIDICLDTFPYNGHTTSLDALWMGVPVISLAGITPIARAGVSILTNLGLPEFIAKTEEEFVQIAANLALDRPRREHLRETLRSKLKASVLMDARQFTRQMEQVYRAMWRAWCAAPR